MNDYRQEYNSVRCVLENQVQVKSKHPSLKTTHALENNSNAESNKDYISAQLR